ncbi:serine/threonine protein kinase [bacterium]|nr:serine/threonine protein kinase [bacterium]
MRLELLLGLMLMGAAPLHAKPPASLELQKPIKLVIRVQPPGASVYGEMVAGGNSKVAYGNNLGYLGRSNEAIDLDLSRFPEGKIAFHVGGSKAMDGPIQPFHGYVILSDFVTEYAIQHNKDGDVVYFPNKANAPLQLQPAPGLGAWIQRTVYWFQIRPILTFTLLALAGAVGFALVAVVFPRQKAWREERARVNKFNERLRNLDVQNDLFLGRQFGEWATVKRLGAGGMAVVYKGVSVVTMNDDEAVAVKVMNPDLAQDVEYRRRFNREVQISRTLDHPNVVRMIDFGEQDNILYLSMEYIQGETLRDLLPEKGFPLPEAMSLALGMVQGLIHAHQRGVVHRDLKPDNVMVTNNNKLVKVMDLGLAKREESENVTRTGDTFGTPAYMAPEQITGGSLLPATDQYALGVMLFEMVTGRRPFEVADSLTLVMKHLQEPPPRVREYKSQLPEELDAMIDRMLLKDPARRFKSLVEVQVELQKIQRKYCPN